jgi:hypothetical protein
VTAVLHPDERDGDTPVRRIVETAVATVGVVLFATAILANQAWLDRHFLPSFFLTRRSYVLLETTVRLAMGVFGIALVAWLRPPIARFVARAPMRAVHVCIAAVLALVAAEVALRYVQLRPVEWLGRDEEPKRRADPRVGWTFVPARAAQSRIGGRTVEYAFDQAGYRVAHGGDAIDPKRPSMLFIGESLMFGTGLTWDESIPTQVGAMTGAQAANLAVDGYSSDQAYMRLEAELPRFSRPVAVVALFMTTLFGRNLDQDRPHLGPGLAWLPAVQHGRLRSLLQLVAPYRSGATVQRGIGVTREVLQAIVRVAEARGATALILVPQVGPEDAVERALRERILDEGHVPYIKVDLDPSWRVPGDAHPDARAAHVLAAAVAARLTGQRIVAVSSARPH